MKKLSGIKLVILGIIIYLPLFIWQFFLQRYLPTWVFLVFAIPAGLCLVIGLLQMHTKKEDELDDSLKETMRQKKYDGR